jgi:ATP-binding protein involved in chromosome partitioning
MPPTPDSIREVLASVIDPELGQPLTALPLLKDIAVDGGAVRVTVGLDEIGAGRREQLGALIRQAAAKAPGVQSVEVRWAQTLPDRVVSPDDPLPTVKNVVLVMSGKGGVGKSTTATNLAMALRRAGYRIGLLDADIYGPSIPTMFGVTGRPVSRDGTSIDPLERFGVKLMSIGFLLDDAKAAIVWRGPMLHGALMQFMKDVLWGDLDYLILDLPPGTGDIALTLSQRVKVTGAVIVTTPQPVATDDVFKSVSMCRKVNIPLLGVVENMSYFIDSAGVRHDLFGRGGGEAVAAFAEAPLLGQVPIDQSVREWGDKGTPVVQAAPFSPIARAFVEIAERLADRIEREHGGGAPQGPVIDRSGGPGGRKRLPIAK